MMRLWIIACVGCAAMAAKSPVAPQQHRAIDLRFRFDTLVFVYCIDETGHPMPIPGSESIQGWRFAPHFENGRPVKACSFARGAPY